MLMETLFISIFYSEEIEHLVLQKKMFIII